MRQFCIVVITEKLDWGKDMKFKQLSARWKFFNVSTRVAYCFANSVGTATQVFPKVVSADSSAVFQCNLPLKTGSAGSRSDFWKNTNEFRISVKVTHHDLNVSLVMSITLSAEQGFVVLAGCPVEVEVLNFWIGSDWTANFKLLLVQSYCHVAGAVKLWFVWV